jgi:hypothetical protein
MNRRKTAPPRGVLKAAAADPQRYQHARYHASPDLEPYVEHYWSVQWDVRGLAPERVETLPHPSVHMIFERTVGGRIAGVARGKFSRLLEGEGGVLAAKFRPGGFHPFVGVPISTFTDTVASLRDVFGAAGNALEQAVLAEGADASRITLIEDFLRRCRPGPDANVARVAEIVYAVAGDRTILKVQDLVDRYDIGHRTLERLFARYVGVGPKWVIQAIACMKPPSNWRRGRSSVSLRSRWTWATQTRRTSPAISRPWWELRRRRMPGRRDERWADVEPLWQRDLRGHSAVRV